MVIVKEAKCPTSPPFGGSEEVNKATNVLVGVDMIVLFPLAIAQTKGEVVSEVNSNP